MREELSLTLRRGLLLPYPARAVNNSTRSQASFSFLEVERIKIAWPKDTWEEMVGASTSAVRTSNTVS